MTLKAVLNQLIFALFLTSNGSSFHILGTATANA